MRAIGYVRVSTAEQAESGLGLGAQRNAITGEVARRGWTLSELAEDAGVSARSLDRPGLQRALHALASGDADALVVARLDRLSRSVLDFTQLMGAAQREGWAIVLLDCPIDTTTPGGEAMAHVFATFAQFERRLGSERTRAGLAQARANGVTLGRPRRVTDRTIARMREWRDNEGMTYREIAARLRRERVRSGQGGRWHPQTVKRLLEREEA